MPVVVQAVDYVTGLLATDPLLGWPFAVFLGMALFALTAFATGEIADMRRLSRRAATRAAADRIAASELHGEAEPLLATLARPVRRPARCSAPTSSSSTPSATTP